MKKLLVVLSVIILIIINFKKEKIIIPNDAIRMRVISSSNNIEDIENKNKISLYLDNYILNLTKNAKNKDEVNNTIYENYDNIKNELNNYMKNNNMEYKYNLLYGRNYFPKKNYKGIKYEEGYYNSLVLELGNKKGLNWWCIAYPPLCTIDENIEDVEYTTIVKEMLNKYNI